MGPEKPSPAQFHYSRTHQNYTSKKKKKVIPTQAEAKMTMAALKGELVYKIYMALTYGLSPLLHLHLHWRNLHVLEHPLSWPERPAFPPPPLRSTPLVPRRLFRRNGSNSCNQILQSTETRCQHFDDNDNVFCFV